MNKRQQAALKAAVRAERKRLAMLRMQMLELHPFWGYLLLQVRLVPAPELPTFAATDCLRHIWYNPLLTRLLDNQQLGFVLAHEIGHQLFATEDRCRGRDRHLWNCATDYAINRIVDEIEKPGPRCEKLYTPPQGEIEGLGEVKILLDERFDGMIAETIYENLAAEDLHQPISISITITDEEQNDGEGAPVTLPGLSDHGGGIDVHLPESLSPRAREELRDRIMGALETWRRGNERGHLPGEMVRHIELSKRNRVPWQRLFRRYAGQALARDEYSLARPSKRYLIEDIVVPGLYAEKPGHVVVAVDTSGSMSDAQLAALGGELENLRGEAGEITLIVADAKVQEVVAEGELDSFLQRGRFKGGGGTDHRVVFDYIHNEQLHPDLFIGITDLCTELPDRRPHFPVIWLVPEEHAPAEWGEIIEVGD